jgi:hypothetical protein
LLAVSLTILQSTAVTDSPTLFILGTHALMGGHHSICLHHVHTLPLGASCTLPQCEIIPLGACKGEASPSSSLGCTNSRHCYFDPLLGTVGKHSQPPFFRSGKPALPVDLQSNFYALCRHDDSKWIVYRMPLSRNGNFSVVVLVFLSIKQRQEHPCSKTL